MTWRRVGAIYLVLAGLAVAFVLSARRPEPTEISGGPPPAELSLLGTDASAVAGVVFQREGLVVRAARDGERWRVLEPAGAAVASDLIAAAVATLTAGQAAEVMRESAGADLDAFGLATPTSTIEVTLAGEAARAVRVFLGARNPTKTAVYARRDDRPSVYLVGLNVRYYEELIFDAVGTPGSGRDPTAEATKAAG